MSTSPQLSYRVSRPEEWRELPPKLRDKACSHRNIDNFGEFVPLLTNGLICEIRRISTGQADLIQLSAIVWPTEPRKQAVREPKAPTARKPKTLSLADLL